MFGLYVDSMLVETSPFPYTEEQLLDALDFPVGDEWCPDENLWMPIYPEKAECRKVTLQEWRRILALRALRKTKVHAAYEKSKQELAQSAGFEMPF